MRQLESIVGKRAKKMKLSIAIMSYNHKNYIEKAIRSVLAQEIDFDYEVWINDDCSTDGTQDILRRLEKELPDNFHIIYREKNIGAVASFYDMYHNRLKGEYFATLEADDYWIYPKKLKTQIEFLDSHPEYTAVAHNVEVVDENGEPRLDYIYPECKNDEYTLKDYQKGILSGQTASLVCRNFYQSKAFKPFVCSVRWAGDGAKNFLLAAHGKVKCIQEVWSAYRYVTSQGDSYSATFKRDRDMENRFLIFHKEIYEHAVNEIKTKESIKITEVMYMHYLLTAALKHKVDNISMKDYFKAFGKAKNKFSCIGYSIKCLLSRK